MRRSRLPVTLAALIVLSTACTSEKPIVSPPAPAPQPPVDSAPYICTLIPEQALRLVSGVTGPLIERTNGTEVNGDCRAPGTNSKALQVWWAQEGSEMPREHLDFLMEKDRRPLYSRHGGVTLPTDLGKGMAAYVRSAPFANEPYRVSARFRCGIRERMVDIYLPQVAKGRDAIKDLIALMRIAQKRYGELYDCTPGP